MHNIHNKWRKPKGRYASRKKKHQLEQAREKNRLPKVADSNASSSMQTREKNKLRKVADSNTSTSAASNDSNTEFVDLSEADQYFLVHSSFFVNLIQDLHCSECNQKTLTVKVTDRNGFCVKVTLECNICENLVGNYYTSPRIESGSKRKESFVVNKIAVESTNSIGVGYAALQKFFANFNMKAMSTRTYQNHLNSITEEAAKLEKKVFNEAWLAVRKAYIEQDPSLASKTVIDIAASYDGTWQKRGHASLYGVGLVIDLLTGLVVDFEILSKYCQICCTAAAELDSDSPEYGIWSESHVGSSECNKNFEGASGSMEVEAAQRIWLRSIKKNNLRYTTVLSDGDARTWTKLKELAPYGSSVQIAKEECVNHVHKRMGKGLRDLAAKNRLGGKKDGALTVNKINLLTKYYRRAIINNSESV